MAEKNTERRHLINVIKFEGENGALVWKHPVEDFNLGSQLIVHESQEALFFRDGQALDLFGPGRYLLETDRLPMLGKIYELPAGGQSPFHSEVYFISLATQMGIKWGTDTKVRLFDPASGLHVELGASGEFSIRVTDSRQLLLRVVGTASSLGQEDLLGGGKGFFRAMVMTQVKSYLAQAIKDNGINVLEIDERLLELSAALRERINGSLGEYGLTMPEFYVSRVVTPDDDPNFRRMKEQYAEAGGDPLQRGRSCGGTPGCGGLHRRPDENSRCTGGSGGAEDSEGGRGGGLPHAGRGGSPGDEDEGVQLPAGNRQAGWHGGNEKRHCRRGFRRTWGDRRTGRDAGGHGRRDESDKGSPESRAELC